MRRTLIACAVAVLATAGANLYAADEPAKVVPPGAPTMAAPAKAEALPKAETILDKALEAAGGKAAFEKLHNTVITGSMEMAAMGIKGTITITKAEPDKSLAEIDISGIGQVKEGYDGKVAWEMNPMQGARLKQGDELAATKREAHFHEENWREQYKKAETVGSDTVDGKDCYKLVLTPNEGSLITQYFDKKTGLLAKASQTVSTPMGEIQSDTTISDYRAEGGLLMAHKILQSAGGQDIGITFEAYKFNMDIPKGKFDLPDEIQALTKK